MRQVDGVLATLAVDHFAVIEDFETEISCLIKFFQVLSVLLETNIDGAHDGLNWRDEDFLLEDDSILGGLVAVRVLNWLTSDDFFEVDFILVGVQVDLELSIRGVVG